MNYQSRIREIQSAFVMGYQDRETCIAMFEELLHDYGLLPKEDQIDRTITNENFLMLLKAAKDHTVNKQIPASPQQPAPQSRAGAELARYRIADSVRRCPICHKPTAAMFNRVQSLDRQVTPVDPPRCQECMMKWVEEKFGMTAAPAPVEQQVPAHTDLSRVDPMTPEEAEFFEFYEKQMQEHQP